MTLRCTAVRTLGSVLLLAALWAAALPLAVAGVPSLSALLPAHSHDTLRGFVPAHTHDTSGDAEAARCASTSSAAHADELACGAEEIASFGAALPSPAPASIFPVAATFATRVLEPLAPRALTIEVTTPPPRG